MKLLPIIKGDIKMQWKYRLHFVYILLTIIYVAIIMFLPSSIKTIAARIEIYSDILLIGLLFMGAVVHYEKDERVLDSLYISPIHPIDYLNGKIISFAFLSLVISFVLGAPFQAIFPLGGFLLSVLFGSLIYSLIGMIISLKTRSLNQFLFFNILTMIVLLTPGIIGFFVDIPNVLLLFPGFAIVSLMNGNHWFISILSLCIWTFLLYYISYEILQRQFHERRR